MIGFTRQMGEKGGIHLISNINGLADNFPLDHFPQDNFPAMEQWHGLSRVLSHPALRISFGDI